MTPQELSAFEKLGNGQAAFEGVTGSVRSPFCAVVALKDRLSVTGSSDLLASVLPKHSPSSILPSDWIEHHYATRAAPIQMHQEATQ